jgi:hypothetical protein
VGRRCDCEMLEQRYRWRVNREDGGKRVTARDTVVCTYPSQGSGQLRWTQQGEQGHICLFGSTAAVVPSSPLSLSRRSRNDALTYSPVDRWWLMAEWMAIVQGERILLWRCMSICASGWNMAAAADHLDIELGSCIYSSAIAEQRLFASMIG